MGLYCSLGKTGPSWGRQNQMAWGSRDEKGKQSWGGDVLRWPGERLSDFPKQRRRKGRGNLHDAQRNEVAGRRAVPFAAAHPSCPVTRTRAPATLGRPCRVPTGLHLTLTRTSVCAAFGHPQAYGHMAWQADRAFV